MSSAGRRRSSNGLPVAVGVVGLVITIGLSWAARSAHADNEDRLTKQRTLEASAVLTEAIPTIEVPLATAAALTEAGSADPALFRTAMGPQVGAKRRFSPASLWSVKDLTRVVQIGDPPALASRGPKAIRAFFERSMRTPGLSLLNLLDGPRPRLGYSYTVRAGPSDYLAYAEQALPPNRTAV